MFLTLSQSVFDRDDRGRREICLACLDDDDDDDDKGNQALKDRPYRPRGVSQLKPDF